MFTSDEGQIQIAKQSAFNVPATSGGIIVPGDQGWNITGTRNKLENSQKQNDGFKRKFALGNFTSKAGGTITYNLNLLGHWLNALCDTLTSAAFDGVLSISVTDPGSGYTSTPTVTFTGGGGTGAAAAAVVVGGQVVAVVLTNRGSGFATAPTIGFTGGGGSGAAATASINLAFFKHAGKLKTGAPLYHTGEKGVIGQSLFRKYPNLVLRKMGLNDTVEGICTMTDEWVGNGKKTKSATSFDTTPTEVTGSPGEYANLIILENGTDSGVISELSCDIENQVAEKRVPNSTGVASELRRGEWTVMGSGKAYFENETLANKMDDQTLTKFQSTITSPDGAFDRLMREVKLEVGDWERSDEGIVLPFNYESIKDTLATNGPIEFTLINGTSSY